jgi:hypothetical protein
MNANSIIPITLSMSVKPQSRRARAAASRTILRSALLTDTEAQYSVEVDSGLSPLRGTGWSPERGNSVTPEWGGDERLAGMFIGIRACLPEHPEE